MQMVLQPAPANPPLLPGAADLNTLMRAILDRPTDVRKFLAEWDEYLKRYETMIEGYGGLVKINTLIAENERLSASAAEAEKIALSHIEQAKQEAEKILREGHADVDAARASLTARQNTLREEIAAGDKRIAEMSDNLKKLTNEAETALREADLKLAAAVQREAAVNAQLEKLRNAGIKVEISNGYISGTIDGGAKRRSEKKGAGGVYDRSEYDHDRKHRYHKSCRAAGVGAVCL